LRDADGGPELRLVKAEALAQVTGFDSLAGYSHRGVLGENRDIQLTYKMHLSFHIAAN
jgi:hypothetical protein